ncbi:phospholipase A1-IIbeta-like [Ipomoea triloba]|uniref:phospholipase A1-IIbeta-like n=1 Tax=Ipomoea triloba TaxID=35885 RepID=UPI00125D50AA|nr:phospholipase A1-IIbeta-like [Ipomoea triloba]
MSGSGIGNIWNHGWKELSGSDNWKDLLEPLDSDLRRYLIHYGAMIEAVGDGFIKDSDSKNVGMPRYARTNLFENTGLVRGNPFKYEVTKYFYATSELAFWKESDWIGYVAVATNEGKFALGRRDIVVVWRGTVRPLEWADDAIFLFVNAPLIFPKNPDPLVHEGWYFMYTTTTDKDDGKSPRDEIREEVERLVELYKAEEVSITVIGHSLGASMATLNAVDLAANPINNNNKDIIPVTAFLYASPKVGDLNFQKAFSNQQNLRALRISDVHDKVPTLPPFGWKDGENMDSKKPYEEVGVGLQIESEKSDYLKPKDLNYHDLMLYMHGIDLYQTSKGKFERIGDFDLAKVNKYQDALNDKYGIPIAWFDIKDRVMVQLPNGNYIVDDHENDKTF